MNTYWEASNHRGSISSAFNNLSYGCSGARDGILAGIRQGVRRHSIQVAGGGYQGRRHLGGESAWPAAGESGGRAKCVDERELAARATRFTRQAITTAGSIEFERPSWDKYGGRIDADVWIDGERLADQLITAGLARRYDGGKRAGWC
jgi:Staphylococcal nuclease homologue